MSNRIILKVLACILVYISAGTSASGQDQKEILYVGTFSVRGSKGVYILQFDRSRGTLTELQAQDEGKDPNFLALDPNGKYLYVVCNEGPAAYKDHEGSVLSFRIDPASGLLTRLNEQPSGGRGPAHISIDPRGRFAYVSNYGNGSFAIYPIKEDGSLEKATDVIQDEGSGPVKGRQDGPHAHSAIPSPDGKFVYVSDLGTDRIQIYQPADSGKYSLDRSSYTVCVPGSGPRHLAFLPDGKFAFSSEELSSKLSVYKVNKADGALIREGRMNTVPDDFKDRNTPGEAHSSPDGKFLYVSNRGHQSLAIYEINKKTGKLRNIGYENVHGIRPRNFCIDKKGEYIFVANQDSDNITVFKRDSKTGKLQYTGIEAKIPSPVSISQLIVN